ncbi:MAG: biopolymer transporter ExbD [Muribaculaceae bacterium]|nr:biopolymer transporter ExbD [Muribaculaceae bacterium]
MALKRPYEPLSLFSMSSMTDVIFLLLIFFMVTSSFIFPSAVDVNLPSSNNQVATKPITEVYLDSLYNISIVEDRTDTVNMEKSYPREVDLAALADRLAAIRAQDSLRTVALYADRSVEYGKVVEILDAAARQNLKMVLATQVGQSSK